MTFAKVVAIHLAFLFVDVIGERDLPTGLLQSQAHESDACEELGKARLGMRIVAHAVVLHCFEEVGNASVVTRITFAILVTTRSGNFKSCCQTRITRQPRLLRVLLLRRSLLTFRPIFFCQ